MAAASTDPDPASDPAPASAPAPAVVPPGQAHDLPAAVQMHMVLRRRIVTADLLPGTRLSEQDIADQYHLSRQPVREAFIRLAGEGLLEVRPQRGTYVARIDMEWVLATRFIRESVEADIVRLAARRVDPASMARLSALLVRQQAIAQGDAASLVALDEEFHQTLAEMAERKLVWRHLQTLKIHLDRVRHLISALTPRDEMLAQHRAIVEAVAAHDPDAAEQAMRTHLRRALADLPRIMRLSPQFFDKAEWTLANLPEVLTPRAR